MIYVYVFCSSYFALKCSPSLKTHYQSLLSMRHLYDSNLGIEKCNCSGFSTLPAAHYAIFHKLWSHIPIYPIYDWCCRLPLSSLNKLCVSMSERGPSLHFPISKWSNRVPRLHRCYLYPMSETRTMIPHRRSTAVRPMTIRGDGDGVSAVGIPLVEYFANALGTSDWLNSLNRPRSSNGCVRYRPW